MGLIGKVVRSQGSAMAKVVTTLDGTEVTVDDSLLRLVTQFTWVTDETGRVWAAVQDDELNDHVLYLDEMIKPLRPRRKLVHLNGKAGDCRLKNLALAPVHRSKRKGASSKFMGVSKVGDRHRWRADIILPDGKSKYLGSFVEETDAAKEYDRIARELYGTEAETNFD